MAEIDLSSSRQRWAPWAAFVFIVFVTTLIFIVLSAINADHMELVVRGDSLQIEEGDFLPWGRSTYEPTQAFTPIQIPEGFDAELPLGPCETVEECEGRMYRSILTMTEYLLAQQDAPSLDEARRLIVRAQLFPSIPLAERAPIEDLTGGVHYVEALVMLEEIRAQLQLVYKKLERSRISGGAHADSQELSHLIQMVEKQLYLLETSPLYAPEEGEESAL